MSNAAVTKQTSTQKGQDTQSSSRTGSSSQTSNEVIHPGTKESVETTPETLVTSTQKPFTKKVTQTSEPTVQTQADDQVLNLTFSFLIAGGALPCEEIPPLN